MTLTRENVKSKMSSLLKQPASRLEDHVELTSLVAESFVLVEMVIELQEEFGVRLVQDDLKDVKTVGDLLRLLESKAKAG